MIRVHRQWKAYGATALLFATAAGCDSLLEVDLPSAVTVEALEDPARASIAVNSAMAAFECAYGAFTLDASGYEDNWQRISGSASAYSEYRDQPSGTNGCDTGVYSTNWYTTLVAGRAEGKATYNRISAWTDQQVANRQRLLAQSALYTALPLSMFGEFFCESSIDVGPLLTPEQTLDSAQVWVDKALAHIETTGDYALTTTNGTIAPSIEQMALGLRARIKWANGDLEGAAADAAEVPNGFQAVVLREEAEDRRNLVFTAVGTGGGASGFLQGPVTVKSLDNRYGISSLGTNPVTGQPWPDPVPFTGYLDLGIRPDGVAVTDAGYPITTATAGAVPDTRVRHQAINPNGPNQVQTKYNAISADIPLISWREMRLIQAQKANEVDNDRAAAIGFINQLRTAEGLPTIAASVAADASQDYVEDMIIEERRRALWLEGGRFWSTKIQNTDKLWFPRAEGSWINTATYQLLGGVRLLQADAEYTANPNFGGLAARGTGCSPDQRPVF